MIGKGNFEIAEKIFSHLVKLYPDNAALNANLGNVYGETKKFDSAVSYIKKAVELDPRNAAYHLNLGFFSFLKGDADASTNAYKQALELSPNNVQALQALIDLTNIYSPVEMQQYIEKLCKVKPTATLIMARDTFVPYLFHSQDEIDKFRDEYSRKIENLFEQNLTIENLNEKIYLNIFYLAYHARNNKDLRIRLADLYEKIAPELNFIAPRCINYKFDKNKKIKIGFASAFFQKHPVSICFNNLIIELAKDPKFDVHIFHIGRFSDYKPGGVDDYAIKLKSYIKPENHKIFSEDYSAIKNEIAKCELDVLIYPDIGMYWLGYFLAFARLAPIQGHLPGHPDTSGIKNMDYYFSSDDLEAVGAEEYYSENLVRFENLPSSIEKPDMPEKFKTRTELGLPTDKNIYYCPMKNQKIHPDFDFAIKEILEKDKNAIILFPKDTGKISDMVTKRINKNIGKELSGRIHYHPWASNVEFLSYLKEADVVLDTFNFGAGTTIYYAFAVDAPIVTLPGITTGGRVTNTVYRKMEILDLIAKDKEDYVRLAVKTANNKEFNKSVRSKIAAKKESIYNNVSAAEELKEFLIRKLEGLSS